MSAPLVSRLTIIGCGLIGSSIAHAARAKGAAGEIVISDLSPKVRGRVVELGIADRVVAALAINLGAKSLELIPMAWVRRITATILLGLGIYTAVIALTGWRS